MHEARAEAERWLASAREDLEYARHAASGGHHAPACFFAQGARAVIGHNVRALIERLDPRSLELDQLLDAARELDLCYVPTRYPNGLQTGTPAQAFSGTQSDRALGFAARFLEAAAAALR